MTIKLTIEKRFIYIQKDEGKIIKSRLSFYKRLSGNDFLEMVKNNGFKGV